MNGPALPPEWDRWDGRQRLAHLVATRTRSELHAALRALLALPPRRYDGECRQVELAAAVVALLEATGADPDEVVFSARDPQGERPEDAGSNGTGSTGGTR